MAALNFPTSPSDGDEYNGFYWDDTLGAWKRITEGSVSPITSGTTPPAAPASGELWWDSETGILYIYYTDTDSSQWVEVSGTPISFNELNDMDDVVLTSPANGESLIYNGTNWVNDEIIIPDPPEPISPFLLGGM